MKLAYLPPIWSLEDLKAANDNDRLLSLYVS